MALSDNFNNKVTVLQGSLKALTTQFELMLKDGKSLAEITDKLGSEFEELNESFTKAQRSLKSGLTGVVKEKDTEQIEVYTKKINSLRGSHKDLERAVEAVKKANLEQQKIANKSVQGQTVDIAKYNEAQRNSTKTVQSLLAAIKERFAEEGRLIKFQTEEGKKLRKADQDLKLSQIKNNGKSLQAQKKQSIDYLNGQLRNLTKHGLKDTEEYRKIQIRREKLTKEFNDKISAENRKLEGKSFKEGFFAQFSPEKIGATLGGLTKLLGGYRVYRAAVNAISKVTVDAARKAIEFQAALGNLGAVAGKSSEEVERLGRNAIDVANATTFTAVEIVGLQTELSKLGFGISEIEQSTLAIAQTAQALGESVDVVARKVGQVLKQFNIDAAETTKVTDTLVATINNSALSFEGFGTAIQYVGPLAAELGTTFAETAGAMALLADNGFTASRVGTGLRGILTELGTDGEDLTAIIRRLADEEISFAEAVDLVGKRNAAQLITLVDNIDALEDAENQYNKAGSALLASSRQVETFDGNMKLLNSAWDAFQIKLGNFVAESGLVKQALKLLSSESFQTASALGVIADLNVGELSDNIDAAVKEYERLEENGTSTQDAIQEAAATTAQQILDNSSLGARYAAYQLELELTAETKKGDVTLRNINLIQEYEAAQKGLTRTLEGQITTQARLNIAQDARDAINTENQKVFDRLLEQKKQENLTAEDAIKHNKELSDELERLRKQKEDAYDQEYKDIQNLEKIGSELTEEQIQHKLEVEATVGQIDIYQGKLANLKISDEEILKLKKKQSKAVDDAQAKELKRLREIIRNEQDALKRKAEKLEFEAKLAEKAGDTALAEEKRQEYLEEQARVYEYLNTLVTENGILTDQNKDALGRMFSSLAIDEKEILDAFNSLVKVYGKALKNTSDEQLIDEEFQKNTVDAFMANLVNIIPSLQNATEEELEPIQNAIYGALFGTGTGKTQSQIKKATQQQIRQLLNQLKDALRDSLSDFNDTAFDNLKSRLDAEKDAIKERYEFEEKILEAKFNNQIISESQYRAKQEQLRKDQIMAENALDKKEFDAEKKRDANQAKIDYLEAIASIFINEIKEGKGVLTATQMQLIGSGIATLRFGAELAAINSRTFIPKKFEQGGLVQGPSHAQGGVPFSVQGRGGYEMEGGEFIVNKRATAMHYDLLNSLNSKYATGYSTNGMFANGGIVRSIEERKEELTLLREIAGATAGTAVNTSKPARAFITNSDIRNNETQQRINNRNTRL